VTVLLRADESPPGSVARITVLDPCDRPWRGHPPVLLQCTYRPLNSLREQQYLAFDARLCCYHALLLEPGIRRASSVVAWRAEEEGVVH